MSTGSMVKEQIDAMHQGLEVIPMDRLSLEQIKATASSLTPDSIVLMTTYYSDATGRIVEFDKFASELGRSSSVPVYHIYDFGLNHGAFGGSLISGRIQGQTAAALAQRVLQGKTLGGFRW